MISISKDDGGRDMAYDTDGTTDDGTATPDVPVYGGLNPQGTFKGVDLRQM
jgi:hypothetical protein